MRSLLCAASLLAMTATAAAQSPDRWPLNEAIAEALARNPEVTAAEKRYESTRQRPAQERSLPDPMVSAGYTSSGNPLPGAGLGTEPTANIGFMVSQELPYPGKLALRASMASRDADAERQQVEAIRLNLTARVTQAYYRLAYAYAVDDVLSRNRSLLNTLLKVSASRYSVGEAAQQDVIKAQTQITILDLQRERVRRERATSEGELNALCARPPYSVVGRPDNLELTAFDASLEALLAAAPEQAPMLRRDQIIIERSQLGVDAARKEYKPDFAVSGGYFNTGTMPPMFEVRFDVKLPLQRAKRAAAVAEQEAALEQARQTYESTRLSLQSRLQEDFQLAATAVRLARLYRDTVLPQARLALESSLASYQTGRVDFLSVLTNFGSVLDYEMNYFEELASYHTAVSRIEEMSGSPLVH